MLVHEQDPDVVRWGLQVFEIGPYPHCIFCEAAMPNVVEAYGGHHFNEEHYGTEPSHVENDEMIAHTVQEELSQLAIAEAHESPFDEGDQSQVFNLQRDWFVHSCGNSIPGQDVVQDDLDDICHCTSSYSSPQENTYQLEDLSYWPDISNEYAIEEVRKWLNEMVSILHVPRMNGEIPSVDKATLDHQRLLERLQVYDLVEHKVEGDGNCQFRALSDQLYRSSEHHEFVRQQVVNQLKSYPETYAGYVTMPYGDYMEKMAKSGEWGDHVTLQAAADLYGVKIAVITSFKDTCCIEILPDAQRSKRVILLSFWAEVHYNSIFPRDDDLPASETKRKRWRMFRNTHTWNLGNSAPDHQLRFYVTTPRSSNKLDHHVNDFILRNKLSSRCFPSARECSVEYRIASWI